MQRLLTNRHCKYLLEISILLIFHSSETAYIIMILVAQTVKRLPTMRETRVRSLGQEDPLEKETATHSSIHAWKIPWN